MAKNFLDLPGLSSFLDNLKETFSKLGHKHTVSDLTDYTVDSAFSATSTNPIQNKTVNEALLTFANDIEKTETDISSLNDEFDDHIADTNLHVDTTEKSNWDIAYSHSQATHARTDATKVAKSSTNGNILINGTETVVYTHPTGTNPHGTTKSDIGLGNVDNTSDANKPVSTAQQAAIDAVQANVDTVSDELTDHVDNADIHFTAAERTKLSGIATGANKYTHPNSGVTAGTYKSVTVNAAGHVTGGTNPTTLSGYGITDAYTKTQVDSKITTHNTSTSAHNDIRLLVSDISTKLNNFLNVDDTTKDQLSEIIALIEDNADDIESITSGKVNVSDIVNNLTTNVANKPLSAAQGVVLKALIDELQAEVDSKADETHGHAIADVSGLQSALDGKANSSHGTHVSFDSTNKPKMDGTAAFGTSTKVARADHIHPTDTSRAAKSDLDALTTTVAGKADTGHKHAISDVTNLQSSLDAKQATITGGASSIASSNLTASRALVSDANGKVAVSAVTSTELGYLDGVTSNIQTQLNGKAASSSLANYLPLSGGTLSGDTLILGGGWGCLYSSGYNTHIAHHPVQGDISNRRELIVQKATESNPNVSLQDAALITDYTNHEMTGYYRLYGEHNKPTASDVGAMPLIKGTVENVDLNTLTTNGIYYLNGDNCINLPTDESTPTFTHSIVQVYDYNSVIEQVLIVGNMTAYNIHAGKVYVRVSSFGSGWTEWKRLGFANESFPLNITPNIDYNSINKTGYYELQGNCPNNPYGSNTDTHFYVFHFHHAVAGYDRQVAYDVRSTSYFNRTCIAGTWTNWSSGTDSDTVDGLHGWQLCQTTEAPSMDLNYVTASGVYRMYSGHTNAPSGVDWGQLIVAHGPGDTIAQLGFDYSEGRAWLRTGNPPECNGIGAWSNWHQLYTTGNITKGDWNLTAGSSSLATNRIYLQYE